jgi:hypothetical protein
MIAEHLERGDIDLFVGMAEDEANGLIARLGAFPDEPLLAPENANGGTEALATAPEDVIQPDR